LAVAKNNILACGVSSTVMHVFTKKHWDKKAVLTFLLCLRRSGVLPELTEDFVIPFLHGIKFDDPDLNGYYDEEEDDDEEDNWEDDDEEDTWEDDNEVSD
jgi:hypothetical protein